MEPSIFYTIKRMLGVVQEDTAFDLQIMVAINGALSTVTQLGVGPELGFRVTGVKESWSDLLGEDISLDMVQSYVYLKSRLLFDPPQNSFLVKSIEDQCKELEWRIVEQVNERRRYIGTDKDFSFGGYDSDSLWNQGDALGRPEEQTDNRKTSKVSNPDKRKASKAVRTDSKRRVKSGTNRVVGT